MADTILSGRWKVFYEAENRQKRIWRDTSVDPGETNSVNELYSALQDLFDELTQLDDGTPMSAQTPTEYTIGIIDTGSKDPWFIDRVSTEYLYGGAIRTASWARVTSSNTGIVRVTCNNTDIDENDIGSTVTHADGDTGTLLDVKGTGAGSILWIRPASFASANNWDSTSGTITVTGSGNTATQSAAAQTGESLWANVFSIGTIEEKTHIYIKQNGQLLTGYKTTTDWWEDTSVSGIMTDHIDILVNVREVGLEIDEAVIQVFARQHSKTYDHFEVDLSAGGRNPVPLSTGNDLDNQVGYKQLTGSSGSGTFEVGEMITTSASLAKGIVTSVSGTESAPVLQYYLIGDPIVDFANTNPIVGATSGATANVSGSTSDVNAALDTDITVTIGAVNTFDVNENDVVELYSIVVDCNSKSLTEVQQRLKYITRRGETTDLDGSSALIQGQFYIGSDRRIIYDSLTGTISTGAVVTQLNTGATGTVVAHHTSAKILILRNSRGTFSNNIADQIQVDGSNYVVMSGTGSTSATVIVPVKASPFGTFAGGRFFGAPGVVLDNVASADASSYQLIDDTGTVVVPPTKVSITIANTRSGDKVAAFRLNEANGIIEKDRYTINSDASAGSTTIVVTPTITIDEPGKTTGGVLRVVDVSAQTEYRIRFASWTGSTFTLASTTGLTADSGTNATTIVDAGGNFNTNARVGDLIRNVTAGAFGYVVSVDSNNQITTTNIPGQTTGDSYQINTVPVALEDGTPGPADTVYVPLIDSYETTGTSGSPGSESATITFSSTIPIRVRARNAGNILPFEQDTTVGSTGVSVSIIRTADTIFTP